MVDIDRVGGVQVIVRELLEAGLLNGDVITCTGETLREQVARLGTPAVDGKVIYPVAKPYKPTGGLRVLGGNLSPDFSAILKLAGLEGGLEGDIFCGRARVFDGEQSLVADARFSGESVGLVIGHVGPEAALGGPIALIEEGDEIVADLNTNELNCMTLNDPATLAKRKAAWEQAVAANGGVHPNCGIADTRLLHRARRTAVPAARGGGPHPNREVWVRDSRPAERSGFAPANKYRPEANQVF